MSRVAFSLFGVDVMWYGILIALGAGLAIYFGNRLGDVEGFEKDTVFNYATVALLVGVVGARTYYVLFEWEYYAAHPTEILAIRNGGLAIYGGIIAGALYLLFFAKHKGISPLRLADTIVPGLALAQGIGRWGNFINQEAYGTPTDVPWAITVDGVSVHPTFLYESVVDIGIFLFLYFVMYKKKKFDGHIAALYGVLYGIGRFIVEGMRTDSLYFLGFRVSQLVSLTLVAVCGIYLVIKFTQTPKTTTKPTKHKKNAS
ncbi:prolipoprotein diacylglyceryl transferase [Peptoniphilus equinus]|uniref:Phosphatidylglycerol--prolipoprotein diacylglyceryl transferase n=1 Tax=Peptoniphilus equinus TaxID=3016343 RepID=A0ABY7QUA4_9FIRM|nr:prolipoprotein diacylglyceryl transferase [Peptoniphilus equinus]WBW50349.1 prolipoprotein diacylglyceryl transferase [Peptoniphilus equinus]